MQEKRVAQLDRRLTDARKQLQVEKKSGDSYKRVLDQYEKDDSGNVKDAGRDTRIKTLETSNQQLQNMLTEKRGTHTAQMMMTAFTGFNVFSS